MESHIRSFEQMASQLCGYTHVCVISFIDLYDKVKKNFPDVRSVYSAERLEIGKAFARIGMKYGMTIKTCAEGTNMESLGIDCGGCMSKETLEKAIGSRLTLPPGYKSARNECACILGNDIGQYDTCGHFCRYCYANSNRENVIRNMKLHDPDSPFLTGRSLPGDNIRQACQESWIDRQLSFDFL